MGIKPGFALRGLAVAGFLLPAAAAAQETLLDGLDYPWDIEAAAEAIYITEKAGTIGVFDGQRFTRMPVRTSAPILNDKGGGLLGLALRPDFAESRRAVAYQHMGTPEARSNRVIEIELDGGGWRETRVLLDAIPGHPLYNGGRLAFGPDGMLYVTTGWTENRERPQDLQSLAGKILRLTPEGAVPADNPWPGSPVWSLGHRNPQGLAWDADGQLYAAEHGQSGHDEVNRIERGANYGWPLIEGDETRDGMRAPLVHSGGRTWAPSGLAWDGDHLVLASLRAGSVLRIGTDGSQRGAIDLGARIRDVLVLGDHIYAITTTRSPRRDGVSDDRMIRISR
ncbi:PQQ-dependent sugar dehydrogenase [Pseudodonghicola flavimaris]|uniref:PQQ-dependent sugar dehydrogenase n=1 Tax=Pseudodonghicola flavimaris TaxID=3050036 RepID=A0ABT7F1B2_9RHOB|nr:PQQ-dependent sugar dehydrogenase [Pseudodonghicola flavimaris]MDK3018379.1 PQQ-dependent sugar dehydrogenase [Pseudodonghicola flavimaris]